MIVPLFRGVPVPASAAASARDLLATLLAVLVMSVSYAQGQGASDEPAGYRELIRTAIEEYDSHSYAEAHEQFRRAHELFPNARTLRGLGLTAFELRSYPDCVRYLEQALASDVRRLDAATRTETEALLGRARNYVGTVQLELSPASATVAVDGHELDESAERPLLLSVGEHILEFSAPSKLGQRRAITVRGGDTQTLAADLVDQSVALAGETTSTAPVGSEREPGRTPLYKKWWLWASIGAAVVGGAVVGTLFATRGERVEAIGTTNTPRGGTLSTRGE